MPCVHALCVRPVSPPCAYALCAYALCAYALCAYALCAYALCVRLVHTQSMSLYKIDEMYGERLRVLIDGHEAWSTQELWYGGSAHACGASGHRQEDEMYSADTTVDHYGPSATLRVELMPLGVNKVESGAPGVGGWGGT